MINIKDRMAQYKTTNPTAKLYNSWPSNQRWELTAIDALSSEGCRLLAGEVYECDNLELLVERGNEFFKLLPSPKSKN